MASQLDINELQTILNTGSEERRLTIYTVIYNLSVTSNNDMCAELNEHAPFDMSLYKRYEQSLKQSKEKYLQGGRSLSGNDGVFFDTDTLGVFGLNPTVIDGIKAVNDNYELYTKAYSIISKL